MIPGFSWLFQVYGYTSEQSAHALTARRSVRAALLFLGSQNQQPGELSCSQVAFRCDQRRFCEPLLCCSLSQRELRLLTEAPPRSRDGRPGQAVPSSQPEQSPTKVRSSEEEEGEVTPEANVNVLLLQQQGTLSRLGGELDFLSH